AGTTAATLLTRAGRKVLLLEKDRFPRYHIGESLMPFTYFTFERLGITDLVASAGFPKKYSVQFVSQTGRLSIPFYFDDHFAHPAAQTWQVPRGEFDQMLLKNARRAGVRVATGVAVTQLAVSDGVVTGVELRDTGGSTLTVPARVTVDASGRGALAVRQFGWRGQGPQPGPVALWADYPGAPRGPPPGPRAPPP